MDKRFGDGASVVELQDESDFESSDGYFQIPCAQDGIRYTGHGTVGSEHGTGAESRKGIDAYEHLREHGRELQHLLREDAGLHSVDCVDSLQDVEQEVVGQLAKPVGSCGSDSFFATKFNAPAATILVLHG